MKSVIKEYAFLLMNAFRFFAESHLASILLLCGIFWIVSSASFCGFYDKHKFLDGDQINGIEQMLNTTAYKPFVYRQLVPILSELAYKLTPHTVREKIVARGASLAPSIDPELLFRYFMVYCISFFSLFLSLFVLRAIALDAGVGKVAAIFSPMCFALAFPYLQTAGGYFYDFTELLFLSLAFLMALRNKVLFLLALILPATLNKETFIFFIPSLYPLLRCHYSTRKVVMLILVAVFAAGIVNIFMKLAFIDAPGAAAEIELLTNLKNYFLPRTYMLIDVTYKNIGPCGASIGTLAVIFVIIFRGWSLCPQMIKRHFLTASAINFPLFLMFCNTGELRNLSLLFVGFVILIAFIIEKSASTKPSSPPIFTQTVMASATSEKKYSPEGRSIRNQSFPR